MKFKEIKEAVLPVLKKHKILRAGVFGSYASNQATKKSDLDLLVELGAKVSLLDFSGIKLELEDILGIKVDLVEYKSLKPLLRESILKQEVQIL